MQTIQTMTHVGADGILNLRLPVEIVDSDVQVTVVVDPVNNGHTSDVFDPEEWKRFIAETAGSIQDPTFFRHEQGEIETREPF
jgi:hypothetical protein